jgi:hypothetical protein
MRAGDGQPTANFTSSLTCCLGKQIELFVCLRTGLSLTVDPHAPSVQIFGRVTRPCANDFDVRSLVRRYGAAPMNTATRMKGDPSMHLIGVGMWATTISHRDIQLTVTGAPQEICRQ